MLISVRHKIAFPEDLLGRIPVVTFCRLGKAPSFDEITICLIISNVYFVSNVIRRISENYVNIYDEFFRKSSKSFVKTVGKWFDTQVSSVQSNLPKVDTLRT